MFHQKDIHDSGNQYIITRLIIIETGNDSVRFTSIDSWKEPRQRLLIVTWYAV